MRDPVWAYWQTTGLTPARLHAADPETGAIGESDQNASLRQAALTRAHEIRQFEIELYWKRATYFWILQAAVFTAIGLTWKSSPSQAAPLVPLALAALGSITAFAGYLSARGSKFWQENWEHHIDMLEDEFEGRLHKTAYVGSDGIAWSVSGVNDRLAFCFFLFWLTILGSAAFAVDASWFDFLPGFVLTNGFQAIAIVVAALLAMLVLFVRKTKFKGAKGVSFRDKVPTYEGSEWIDASQLPEVKDLAKLRKPFLIRREPKT